MNALGLVEIRGWSAAMVILDSIEKSASIELQQVELNDLYGVCLKFTGSTPDIANAIDTAVALAKQMRVEHKFDLIPNPSESSLAAWLAKPEFSPLIEQNLVYTPRPARQQENNMAEQAPFAIGMIETQGLTAVIEAIDTACKAANVEVLGREKLGGGYITVLIKGDTAAVKTAIEAGKVKVEGLGKLIAAHVIPRPSQAVLALLTKS